MLYISQKPHPAHMMPLSIASTFIHIRSLETACKATNSTCTFLHSHQSRRDEKVVSYKQSILGQHYMRHVRDILPPPKKCQTFLCIAFSQPVLIKQCHSVCPFTNSSNSRVVTVHPPNKLEMTAVRSLKALNTNLFKLPSVGTVLWSRRQSYHAERDQLKMKENSMHSITLLLFWRQVKTEATKQRTTRCS